MRTWFPRPKSNVMDRKILVRIRILQNFLYFFIFLAFYFWSWFGSLSRWEPDILNQKAMLWIFKILVRIRILQTFIYFFIFLAFYFWSWFRSLSRWEPDFLDQKAMLWIRKFLVRIQILQKIFYFFYFLEFYFWSGLGSGSRLESGPGSGSRGSESGSGFESGFGSRVRIWIREAQKHQTIQIRIHNTTKKVTKVWTFFSYFIVHKKLPESTSVSPSARSAGGST